MLERVKNFLKTRYGTWTRIVSLEHVPETLEDAKKIIDEAPRRTHIFLEREATTPPLLKLAAESAERGGTTSSPVQTYFIALAEYARSLNRRHIVEFESRHARDTIGSGKIYGNLESRVRKFILERSTKLSAATQRELQPFLSDYRAPDIEEAAYRNISQTARRELQPIFNELHKNEGYIDKLTEAIKLDSKQRQKNSEAVLPLSGTLRTRALLHQVVRSKSPRRLVFAGVGHSDLMAAKLGIPVFKRLPEHLESELPTAEQYERDYEMFKESSPEIRELSRIIREETGIRLSRLDITELYSRETAENEEEQRILEIIARETPALERKYEERQTRKPMQ